MMSGVRELQYFSHVYVRWFSDSLQYLSAGLMLEANINMEHGTQKGSPGRDPIASTVLQI